MSTRRSFIKVAASALPAALGLSSIAAASGTSTFSRVKIAVIDEDHLPAFSVSRRLSQHGVPVASIRSGDVTEAWLRAVRPTWQRGRASIAGLTTPAALFCLEQFAYLHGLRVVFHAEHVLLRDGSVQHEVQRAPQRVTAATLQRAGQRWPQRLADALMAPAAHGARRPGPSLAALEPALPAGATLLTSWIIA